MNYTIDDLLPFCQKCEGTGELENLSIKRDSSFGLRPIWASPVVCDKCYGKKVLPTEAGKTLIEFIKRAKLFIE